jgi:hypothetical protein
MVTASDRYWPSHWADNGCKLAPSCLACQLPQCIHDRPQGQYQRELTRRQDLVRLPVALALPLAEAARMLGVTERTVHRILARGRQVTP